MPRLTLSGGRGQGRGLTEAGEGRKDLGWRDGQMSRPAALSAGGGGGGGGGGVELVAVARCFC